MSKLTVQILPNDILVIIMQYLNVKDLAVLSRTCKALHSVVYEYGWKDHLRLNPRPSYSLSKVSNLWRTHTRVRYDTLNDSAWSRAEFVARPLSRPWHGKLQPLLAINNSRLIVAAGNALYSYVFTHHDLDAPGVQFECMYTFTMEVDLRGDITGLACIQDEGLDRTVYVGFEDGRLERVLLPSPKSEQQTITLGQSSRSREYVDWGDLIESLSSSDDLLLSLSTTGRVNLFRLGPSSPSVQSIDLQARSWSTHLSTQSSGAYAAFGTSSQTPLVVHPITESEMSSAPSAILHSSSCYTENPKPSAVYGISSAPPAAPWGSSDQILVSGWYDGRVRVHDLRSSTRLLSNTAAGPAPLAPVLSLYDPWSFEPIYTVACGGGSSSHIAAGSARHSVVAFWDIRSPGRGWSVHAPGNDSSPVYSIILESSRVFGATQSRPFVYDFGPGVTHNTYPRLPANRDDGLQHKKGWNGVGYYVTKYHHGPNEH